MILVKYPKPKKVRSLEYLTTDTEGSGGFDITTRPSTISYITNNTLSTIVQSSTIQIESTTIIVNIENDLNNSTNITGSTSAAIIGLI